MNRLFQHLLLALALLPFFSAQAEDKSAKEGFVAGTHYEVLATPVRTADPDKIEVAEFFWYGCPHCYHFEPSITAWKKTKADDVNFVQVPAIWHPDMTLHAKMFYTAQQLNKLPELHEAFFTAMQVGKLKLNTPDEIQKMFVERGVSADEFKKMFNSFGTDSMVKQAQAKASGSKVSGTPEIVVNGKYRISAKLAGSQPGMLKVVDFLVEKERKEKK
jgi:thiol:disulfide interchange protein DsbA